MQIIRNGFANGHYYSASQFYKEKFGVKAYKISLDAGTTCPNRDGTKGAGGCVFCSQSGSGDFSASRNLPLHKQIEDAKKLVSKKIKGGKYIAYFQNYTNTYGDEALLVKKYNDSLSEKDIAGLSIATRPDCISPWILEQIAHLSEKTFVSLELGFQTSNEKTGGYINRLYTNEDYVSAVKRIKSASLKIHIVTHLIFGLPYESEKDMLQSLDFALKSGTDGLKISCLHVLKNTRLFDDFKDGKFKTLSMEEYFSLLGNALPLIPKNIVIHRLTGDGAKSILVSPMWTADKKNVLNSLNAFLEKEKIVQGSSAESL